MLLFAFIEFIGFVGFVEFIGFIGFVGFVGKLLGRWARGYSLLPIAYCLLIRKLRPLLHEGQIMDALL